MILFIKNTKKINIGVDKRKQMVYNDFNLYLKIRGKEDKNMEKLAIAMSGGVDSFCCQFFWADSESIAFM